MKTQKVVRWGIHSDSISDLVDNIIFWYRDDIGTWRWVSDKEQATQMDINQAVALMQYSNRFHTKRVFVMEFVE